MSTAKEKKYAKRMRNQPSSVSLSDFGSGQGGRPPSDGGRGSFHSHRDSHPGTSRGQQQRFQGQSPGTYFQTTEGKGRGGPPDAHLVPKYITATMFAQARAAEINAMAKAVSQKTSNCLVFQSLPRHMRRRAMGYDIKRLPRRLREIAKKEMDKSVHQKKEQSKSKCRKARRRHGNLQMEFNRRQRKNVWLETHIWHTKRFHMLKKWGYCLPDRPTMKSYRTCYRAMTSNCLLQDLSYLCCLELIGEEEELLKSLSRLCSTDTGPSFAAAQCLSGRRQGSLVLYKADKYPEEALAPVTFIWKPNCAPVQPSNKRQLWIWTHPAFKKDILKELQNVFWCEEMPDNSVCKPEPAQVLQQEETQAVVESPGKKRKRQDKDGEKAVPVKKIVSDGTRDSIDPYQWTSKQASVTIRDLTMEIVRYRLVGPLSHCVLTEALRAAPLHKAAENPGPHSWWASYCTDPDNVHLHSRQESLFQLLQGLEDPAQVPPGTVLGLTLGDPRLNLPKKKTKAVPNLEKYEDRDQTKLLRSNGVPVECADSLIWSSEIRSKTTENKISEQEFNRLRGELLVPGSQLDLGDGESKIPVLLIQQPGQVTGTERPGWGSGWDICLPKGWGMAFWIPFIYRGVRVGGLQQSLQHSQFMAAPYVPGDFVDCPAGHQSAKDTEIFLLDKYKRRPPAKRTNFIKHGILAPFRCPWEQLTREWEIRTRISTEPPAFEGQEQVEAKGTDIESSEMLHVAPTEDVKLEICSPPATNNESKDTADKEDREITYSVLRNKRTLRQLSVCCLPCRGRPRAHQPSKSTPQDLPDVINLVPRDVPRLLVWVRLSMLNKGSPELHAVICIPSSQDFLELNNKSFPGPQEPKHSDTFKKKVLKCQKDKKKEKTKKKNDPSKTKDDLAENLSDEQLSQRDELTFGLWPQPLPELTTHCNRHLIGFVTQGNFSMVAGCGEALGFVCVSGLTHMLSSQPADKKGFVLVRNPSSLQYRFAKLFIDV